MAECWFSKPRMWVRIPLLASWECGEMVDTYGLDPYANSVWVRIPLFPSAWLAQLVEQRTENPRVSGSIPELSTLWVCNSVGRVESL